MPVEQRFTISTAADAVGFSSKTVKRLVERLVSEGKMNPTRTPGGHLRFTQDEIDYLEKASKMVSTD